MKKSPKNEWMSVESWDLTEKRADKKKSLLNTLSRDASNPLELEYAMLVKTIKKSIRADNRRSIEQKAQKAEEAAKRGDSRSGDHISSEIVGNRPKTDGLVKDESRFLLILIK